MSKWMAFYADGSTFGSEDGKPEAAPDGVQAIAEERDGRAMVHTGGEFYRWDGRGWRAEPVLPDVKVSGKTMDLDAFQLLKAEAIEWHTLAS